MILDVCWWVEEDSDGGEMTMADGCWVIEHLQS